MDSGGYIAITGLIWGQEVPKPPAKKFADVQIILKIVRNDPASEKMVKKFGSPQQRLHIQIRPHKLGSKGLNMVDDGSPLIGLQLKENHAFWL